MSSHKLYVWSNMLDYLGVAHATSIDEARRLLLGEMGESGDGSCPERDKARKAILETTPGIWAGANAEFCLSSSAESREQELLARTLELKLAQAKRDGAIEEMERLVTEMREDICDRNPVQFASRGKVEPGYVEALDDTACGIEYRIAELRKAAHHGN